MEESIAYFKLTYSQNEGERLSEKVLVWLGSLKVSEQGYCAFRLIILHVQSGSRIDVMHEVDSAYPVLSQDIYMCVYTMYLANFQGSSESTEPSLHPSPL